MSMKGSTHLVSVGDANRLRVLETILDISEIGTWAWSGDEFDFDARCQEVIGYPSAPCRLPYLALLEMTHPEDRAMLRAALLMVRSGRARQIKREVRLQTPVSAWKWIEIRAGLSEDEQTVHGIFRDIAARKMAEYESVRLGRELSDVIESIPGCVYRSSYDQHWSTLFVNEAFENLTGYSCKEARDQRLSIRQLVYFEDLPHYLKAIQDSIDADRPYDIRYRLQTCSGELKWIYDRGCGVRDGINQQVTQIAGVMMDITATHAQEEQIRLFESVLSNTNDSVLITEAEPSRELGGPRILWVNQAFMEETGYTLEEVVGRTPHFLQGPESPQQPLATIREALRNWEPVEVEVLNYRKDGSPFWSELSIAPIADESGWFTHWVSVQRNVTARKQAEREAQARTEALRIARDAAEAGMKAKSAFLSTMSHEIRTPLNGVLGMASLLEDTSLDAEQKEFVDTIRASGDTLLAVLNNILDFSRFEAGHVELELQPFDLVECIQAVLQMVSADARKKSLRLQYVIDPDVSTMRVGDSTRLRQVLLNLVSNAVKFTLEGEVVLSVRRGEGADRLVFSVRDSGIGIPADRQENLFEAFSQVDASITRRFGGTGLGLAICRQLVARMGGEIVVESREGKGSTFTFTAQLRPHTVAETPSQNSAQRSDGAAVHPPDPETVIPLRPRLAVLVVEDHPVNQRVIDKLLVRLGIRADMVSNGAMAMTRVREKHYDLVLMDMQMPIMDGITATREIRNSLDESRQPVIVALTANAFAADRIRCMEAGMDGFMTKPVRLESMAQVVDALIDKEPLPVRFQMLENAAGQR
ncbi:MAG: ATP-binding protein [Myxococcota bacterium]